MLHPNLGHVRFSDSVCENSANVSTALASEHMQMAVITWSQSLHFACTHPFNVDFVWSSLQVLLSKSSKMTGHAFCQTYCDASHSFKRLHWLCMMRQCLKRLGREHIPSLSVHKSKSTSEKNILFEWVESLMERLLQKNLPFSATEWSQKHPSDPHEPLSLQDQCVFVCVSNWIRVFYSISPLR